MLEYRQDVDKNNKNAQKRTWKTKIKRNCIFGWHLDRNHFGVVIIWNRNTGSFQRLKHTHIEGYFVSNVVCVVDIMPDGRSACDLCKIRIKKIFTLHERMINELMLNKSHKRKINNRLKKRYQKKCWYGNSLNAENHLCHQVHCLFHSHLYCNSNNSF